jgi:hypothetical protein
LFFASEAWVFYLFAVIFGLSGGEMVGSHHQPAAIRHPRRSVRSIPSRCWVPVPDGLGAGCGILFDLSGGYTWSILLPVIGYLGLPLALALPRHEAGSCPRRKLRYGSAPAGPCGAIFAPAPVAATSAPAFKMRCRVFQVHIGHEIDTPPLRQQQTLRRPRLYT